MTDTRAGTCCDYCGLPLSPPTGDARPLGGHRYCCFGCRFAASITASNGEDGHARWMMTRLGLAIFFTMNVMVFTMLLWSQPDAAGPAAGIGAEPAATALYGLARHACLLFTVPVLLLLGGPLCEDALEELRRGRASLNLLLLVGVVAAFVESAWSTWSGSGHVYFEVACMVLVAVTLGRWLDASGKLRTTAALRELRSLLPDRVRRVVGGTEGEVDLSSVVVGDVLRILPGEHVPTDGTVALGEAAIDERTVTGESVPVVKRRGEPVYSGTCNLDGQLLVDVTAPPGAGTLERLIETVSAAANGSREQRLAERVSNWFLPLVLVTAAVACGLHWRLSGPSAGVLAGLAVVVVSCPCALGLATPMALWAAVGHATRRHILIRDGDAFTRLAAADAFCFDKTGTLTTGCRVTAVERRQPRSTACHTDPVAIAAALAHGSTHVFARAISLHAAEKGVVPVPIVAPRTIAGCGVEAALAEGGTTVRLGSPHWIQCCLGDDLRDPGIARDRLAPQCLVAAGRDILGGIWFAEIVRPEAAAAVAAFRGRNARTLMLSGDRQERAAPVAAGLGLECRAPLLPAEKLAAIEALQREGRCVAMVGDGINDSPALATADVGVALGCGADVSRWSADICLLRDDLADLPWLTELASRTTRTIRWNLIWAFGYNAACIPLAACGWIHPAIAAAAMVASSLLVVTNSLRLAHDDVSAATQGEKPAEKPLQA